MTGKYFIFLAGLLGALGVGLGAFGAHALRPMLEASQRLDTFDTAVKYHFYHVLALLLTGLLHSQRPHALFAWAGYLHLAGLLIFSGSLYALCLSGQRWLGAVTPLGGVAFIAGWVLLAWGALKQNF
jgi:uncharacterized membrane protein YgdD (TMEM256/DUF423 family)